jgi:uncharacterized membrane protein YhaH (DUF805 family)
MVFLSRLAAIVFAGWLFFLVDAPGEHIHNSARTLFEFSFYIWFAFLYWANSWKRWHDCARPGLYAFVNLIPVVGVILGLLLNIMLPGTEGANAYGDRYRGII